MSWPTLLRAEPERLAAGVEASGAKGAGIVYKRKALGLLATAALLAPSMAVRADIAVLDLIVDPPTGGAHNGPGTWHLRVRLWGDGGVGDPPASAGLADFVIDKVAGSGGVHVVASTNESAQSWWEDAQGVVRAGFWEFRSNGVAGVGITATQNSNYAPAGNDPRLDYAVYQGIGISDGSWSPPAGAIGGQSVSWDANFLLASGTYAGAQGTLTVEHYGPMSFATLANAVLGGGWSGPGTWGPPLTAIFADSEIVPEPASLALLALGGLVVMRRRRK
jgi:hypothetical protein